MVVDGTFDVSVFHVSRMVGPNVGRIFTNTYPPQTSSVGTHTAGEPLMYDNGWIGPQPGWSAVPTPWKIYEAVCAESPRNSAFYVNGVLIGEAGSSSGHDNRWNLSGYDATGNQETCDCEVAEMVTYDYALSPQERQQVENYLYEKWMSGKLNTVMSEDSGAGLETGLTAVTLPRVEVGAGSDLAQTLVLFVRPEAGAGMEVGTATVAPLLVQDSAAGADAGLMVRAVVDWSRRRFNG